MRFDQIRLDSFPRGPASLSKFLIKKIERVGGQRKFYCVWLAFLSCDSGVNLGWNIHLSPAYTAERAPQAYTSTPEISQATTSGWEAALTSFRGDARAIISPFQPSPKATFASSLSAATYASLKPRSPSCSRHS